MDKITVVDTYVKADVNRGTFYKYYRDVPDLYDKTEDSLVKEIYALLENTNRSDKLSQCQQSGLRAATRICTWWMLSCRILLVEKRNADFI